jgi:hypothetical protein
MLAAGEPRVEVVADDGAVLVDGGCLAPDGEVRDRQVNRGLRAGRPPDRAGGKISPPGPRDIAAVVDPRCRAGVDLGQRRDLPVAVDPRGQEAAACGVEAGADRRPRRVDVEERLLDTRQVDLGRLAVIPDQNVLLVAVIGPGGEPRRSGGRFGRPRRRCSASTCRARRAARRRRTWAVRSARTRLLPESLGCRLPALGPPARRPMPRPGEREREPADPSAPGRYVGWRGWHGRSLLGLARTHMRNTYLVWLVCAAQVAPPLGRWPAAPARPCSVGHATAADRAESAATSKAPAARMCGAVPGGALGTAARRPGPGQLTSVHGSPGAAGYGLGALAEAGSVMSGWWGNRPRTSRRRRSPP